MLYTSITRGVHMLNGASVKILLTYCGQLQTSPMVDWYLVFSPLGIDEVCGGEPAWSKPIKSSAAVKQINTSAAEVVKLTFP